jgi:DNA-binding CsgD family transcriptional regulator
VTVLRGRSEERGRLARLLDSARGGTSATLVIRGEAGVGKTALLNDVAERASGCRVVRANGVESEMGYPFAALLQLLRAPILRSLEQLAPPQRDALRRAFGLAEGAPPQTYMVGLATLTLLSQLAGEQPVVCLVDDVQWLDRESLAVLSFVARRLAAEPIVILFAVRESSEPEMDGLPELVLTGLAEADARLLLDEAVPGGVDERVRERIVAETRGNPLALLELPRGMTPAEFAGGFGLPTPRELVGRVERAFAGRVAALPHETQRYLLLAAADAVGDAAAVGRAAEHLGLPTSAPLPAEDAGLVDIGPPICFRHPLVRSAAYRAASPDERRRVHDALAGATDPERDPDRRAWHRAHAVTAPDEDVAADLERSASRARARGGVAAAAAFLERAANLSPDELRRGRRALAAARSKFEAGAPDDAERLLAVVAAAPLKELDHACAERLRAQIAFARTRGSDTPSLLSAAAKLLEPVDPVSARETHLEALWAAVRSGRFARRDGVVEAAEAAMRAAGPDPERAIDLLLDAVIARLAKGYEAALPAVARSLAAFRTQGLSRENLTWCWLACQLAMDMWDDGACETIASGLGRLARESGGLSVLPFALNYSAAHQLFLGEFGIAHQLVHEAETLTEATRGVPVADFSVLLAAWQGERARTNTLRAAMIEAGTAHGEGFAVEVAEWAAAVLHNGLGEYGEATAAARRAYDPGGLGFGVWILPELIEAAAHSGDRVAAEYGLAQLTARSKTSTKEWARGVEAAAQALLCGTDDAERLHLEAIDHLGRSRVVVLHARAQLSYGEWLRRQNRRVDARIQLKAALAAFDMMGARGFAERARRELLATGETVRKRTADARESLTPQEAQIARLAARGHSNGDIAAQLYLSHRTVEWHLHKVFAKLGIVSRKGLADALPASRSELVPV